MGIMGVMGVVRVMGVVGVVGIMGVMGCEPHGQFFGELQALFIVGTSYKLAPAGECLVSGAYHRTFLSAIGCPWCRRKRAKSYCME